MLTAFARAFQTPDLRKKLLFTLGIVVLFRLGAHVPVPGVSYKNVQTCMDAVSGNSGSLFGLVNLFSGGALLQLTIFALGIMPYITASIILQLLVVVIPRLEALKKEGQAGQTKITQYTRYLTVALGVLQATGLVATARSGALFSTCPLSGPDHPEQFALHHDHDGHLHDRRYHRNHVAGRDDHRQGYRQRHVDPDVRLHRRRLPGRAVEHQEAGQAGRRLDRVRLRRAGGPGRSSAWWSSSSRRSAGSRCSTPSG